MKNLSFFLLALPLGLIACAGPKPADKTNEQILEEAAGPNIEGVNQTMSNAGKAALDRGDYKKAGEIYRQLLDKDGTNPTYLLDYAEAARRAGRFDSAEGAYGTLLKLHPDNIDAKEGQGLTLMGEEKFEDAGTTLSEVMKTDPKRWRTLNALGLLFVHKNMFDEGVAYFTEALKQSPNNPAVLNNVGLTQAIQKDYPDATMALKKASSLAQAQTVAKEQIDLNLAMVYAVAGDLDLARQTAGVYLKGPALDNNMGLYAYLASDDRMAKDYLNMALTESPKYYERAWKNLSEISGGGVADKPTGKSDQATTAGKHIKID